MVGEKIMDEPTVEPKPKQKRRTKAQMAASRAVKAEDLLGEAPAPVKKSSKVLNNPMDLPPAEPFVKKGGVDDPRKHPSMSVKTEKSRPAIGGDFGVSLKSDRKSLKAPTAEMLGLGKPKAKSLKAPTAEMMGITPTRPTQQPTSATRRNPRQQPTPAIAPRRHGPQPPVSDQQRILTGQKITTNTLYVHRIKVTRVVDGDTVVGIIDMGFGMRLTGDKELGVKIRLVGIDTPERGSSGYEEATTELKRILLTDGTRPKVTIAQSHAKSTDNFGRYLYEFFDTTGESINQGMVKRGFAKPYTR